MTEQTERILHGCPLFEGIVRQELPTALASLDAAERAYEKGEIVFHEGEPARYVGVVLGGEAQIIREDYYGTRCLLARITPGEIFGEVFACAGVELLPVSVVAVQNCRILLLDSRRLAASRESGGFSARFLENLLSVTARKNLMLNRKIELLSKRTTREKLMAYLLLQAKEAHSDTFTIPYDRQQLADYLSVERSAMSAELGKLRRAGVLDCVKNRFHLYRNCESTEQEPAF